MGYLAAGIAHDFNNLLTGIMGSASLLLEDMPAEGTARFDVQVIVSGAERAAELTRQLLAYAGKSRYYLERLSLTEMAIQTSRLVNRSIPDRVQLRLDLDKHLPLLLADPSQIQQVVMNLIINAAEAIGDAGGAIRLRTGVRTLTSEPLPDSYLTDAVAPGDYVFPEVQDNGCGMDAQTIRRIFDPFFTTKFTGRGLGLSALPGIVRQHKGAIQLHSIPGKGTSFTVYFPSAGPEQQAARDVGAKDPRGTGTILVVDDEEIVRSLTRATLERYGYQVLTAVDGPEGIRVFRERSGDIALVILDVAMPGMDGAKTLERMLEIRGDVRVLICSGFGNVDLEMRFAGRKGVAFFPKPYTAVQLAGKVKDYLAAGA